MLWLVKNGHLIVLTCISYFNELRFVFMSDQNFFCDTVQCFFEEKWTVGNYLNFTLHLHRYFRVEKAKINLHMTLKLTVFMMISCLMQFRRHLVFNVVTSTYAP